MSFQPTLRFLYLAYKTIVRNTMNLENRMCTCSIKKGFTNFTHIPHITWQTGTIKGANFVVTRGTVHARITRALVDF